jgi:hypothetical protein
MTDGGDRDDARGTPRDGRGATIPEGDDSAGRSPEGDDDMSLHAEGATAADQLARAELKKRTLEMWLALKDTRVKLDLYGGCAFARVLPVRPRAASRALRPRPPAILSSEPQCTAEKATRHRTNRFLLIPRRRPPPTPRRSVEVSGVFQAVDATSETLLVSELDSGVGVVPVARVRWSDVLSVTTLPRLERESESARWGREHSRGG